MSDLPPSGQRDDPPLPPADERPSPRFSLIWIIPLVALIVAAYLGYTTISSRGPLITLTFGTATGLTAGQTKVKHKAVDLGTVESIRLSDDLKQVTVRVRMTREATPYLTDHARFWVVRPRLSASNISGLETLLSGAYIELDPGLTRGRPERSFKGLEDPPGVRSDEPGHTFTLRTGTIGSLGAGSPVFYRDVVVGEVLGYDPPHIDDPILVHVFVRAPYDQDVRRDSHFWNASGLSVAVGATGLHVEIESLQAVIAGGVAFGTEADMRSSPVAPDGATFPLFKDLAAAQAAGYRDNIPFVSYFQNSVSGLGAGSAVTVFGIQIGTVTDVRLLVDPNTGTSRVRVAYNVQPERIFGGNAPPDSDAQAISQRLVANGLRAQLETSNYLTGSLNLSLAFFKSEKPGTVGREGEAFVMPSQPGNLQDIANTLDTIVNKVNGIPIQQIGGTVLSLLDNLNGTVGSPQLKEAVSQLSSTLTTLQTLIRHADAGLDPVLKRLPDIANNLQDTARRADRLLGSVDQGYGQNSEFARQLSQVLSQVNDTARSIRLLADFLDRHPEALIRGRAGDASR